MLHAVNEVSIKSTPQILDSTHTYMIQQRVQQQYSAQQQHRSRAAQKPQNARVKSKSPISFSLSSVRTSIFPLSSFYYLVLFPSLFSLLERFSLSSQTTTTTMRILSLSSLLILDLLFFSISFSLSLNDSFVERNNADLNLIDANSTNSTGSFADMFDRALEKEFTENDQTEGFCFFRLFCVF